MGKPAPFWWRPVLTPDCCTFFRQDGSASHKKLGESLLEATRAHPDVIPAWMAILGQFDYVGGHLSLWSATQKCIRVH